MKILHSTYHAIVFGCPGVPPETGGILGASSGIISHYLFDKGDKNSNSYDFYSPNIDILNREIEKWSRNRIAFCGIYHSHFPEGINLSESDMRYIGEIMRCMPEQINYLFFPVVFSKKYMIAYRADRYGAQIQIVRDKIELY